MSKMSVFPKNFIENHLKSTEPGNKGKKDKIELFHHKRNHNVDNVKLAVPDL